MVPVNLKKKVLHANNHTTLAGNPGVQKLYHSIRMNYYCLSLTVYCYATALLCPLCARNEIKLRKNVGGWKFLQENAPLQRFCIDIIGELIDISLGKRYLIVIVD